VWVAAQAPAEVLIMIIQQDHQSSFVARLNDRSTRVDALRELLGMDVILLPVQHGKKAPMAKGWQLTNIQAMADAKHLKQLERSNIGVLNGSPSCGLCSIDLDDGVSFELFFRDNPQLEGTLVTTGARGANVWVRIKGEFPRTFRLKNHAGESCGEWRSDGGQTVIFGRHPTGCDYRFLTLALPIEISFDEIILPAGTKIPHDRSPCYVEDVEDTVERSSTSTTSLHNKEPQSPVELRCQQGKFNSELAAIHEDLPPLFDKLVLAAYRNIKAGERNQALVELVTRLFEQIDVELVVRFAMGLYVYYGYRFKDDGGRHEYEVRRHLESLQASYTDRLSSDELDYYQSLAPHKQSAFRIFRSLALDVEKTPEGQFFMSCHQLAIRLGLSADMQGKRALDEFTDHGVISLLVKGTRRTAGKQGTASSWEWKAAKSAGRSAF
jgi:hypothetical protein